MVIHVACELLDIVDIRATCRCTARWCLLLSFKSKSSLAVWTSCLNEIERNFFADTKSSMQRYSRRAFLSINTVSVIVHVGRKKYCSAIAIHVANNYIPYMWKTPHSNKHTLILQNRKATTSYPARRFVVITAFCVAGGACPKEIVACVFKAEPVSYTHLTLPTKLLV